MPSTVTILALIFAVLGVTFLIAAFAAVRRRRFMRLTRRLVLSIALFAIAAFFAALTIGTQGYRALTREQVAAIVETQPLGAQRFRVRMRFPDGRVVTHTLAGDELYVDAHILKWKPIANIVGLHTAYELDRVGGRYERLDDEQNNPRTVYGIGNKKPVDMFSLRQRYALLEPLLDAEYGSATFIAVEQPATLEVRVSTTGLLIRRMGSAQE
jgi:4-amino-4-deoxy-L-arabinose transferase-like glycosyltransferase